VTGVDSRGKFASESRCLFDEFFSACANQKTLQLFLRRSPPALRLNSLDHFVVFFERQYPTAPVHRAIDQVVITLRCLIDNLVNRFTRVHNDFGRYAVTMKRSRLRLKRRADVRPALFRNSE
jgi:hypothetical protein